MTQKPKTYKTVQLQYWDAFDDIGENIEESCNKMLEQGYVLKDSISIHKKEGRAVVVLIFAQN